MARKTSDEDLEKAALRLFNLELPRRYRRSISWEHLHEFERSYCRWAAQSIIDAIAGREIVEMPIRRIRGRPKHGYSPAGKEVMPEYRCWVQIKSRCFNPKHSSYDDYGGRGITICEKWRKSFPAFLADVGLRPSPKHSIDRFPNNDGDYELGNVRWATKREQVGNRRTTLWVNHNGKRLPISDVCRLLKINPNAVWMRLSRGATPEEAIALTKRRLPSG